MKPSSRLTRALVANITSPAGMSTSSLTLSTQFHFSTSSPRSQQRNRILDAVTIPPAFHDYLRLCSSNNTLLLALFTTSACTPCRTITPLLTSLVESRSPLPQDKYSALALTEVELDSPDRSNGSMMDLGIEWGIRSMPTLVGFGGRRAERVTDRITDTAMMSDQARMKQWVDEEMAKGDPFATGGGGGGGFLKGLFG